MEPALLVLAAGMGSRYGGMKQTDSFGPSGETITDYSIYDALRAGFGKIVFVISPKMEEDFNNNYLKRFPAGLKVGYVLQSIDDVPDGFKVPDSRKKPWGTAHAVLMARKVIDEPFAVINADDFYGRKSYEIIYRFLKNTSGDHPGQYCMVGFQLDKTVSRYGSVARGICSVDEHGYLTEITERTKILVDNNQIFYETDEGKRNPLDPDEMVSMNLFGFTPDFFQHIENQFRSFIHENIDNPKAELFIPLVVDNLINSGTASMTVLSTPESWFGVTYQEDKPHVTGMIQNLVKQGLYPVPLWK
ncbi:MAG: nucleotidyltransferase [Bacteroidales bacterium]|nr:nucleotidyltransferase [Bacteroidales bacterium]